MIILMAISAFHILFQIVLTLLNGVSFGLRSIDEAVYRPGARVQRLALLQQSSPFWDFRKRILEAKDRHCNEAAVADGLQSALKPFAAQSVDNSATETANLKSTHDCKTVALPFFLDLLNVGNVYCIRVSPPELTPCNFISDTPEVGQHHQHSLFVLERRVSSRGRDVVDIAHSLQLPCNRQKVDK
jgi:hypothetical protein